MNRILSVLTVVAGCLLSANSCGTPPSVRPALWTADDPLPVLERRKLTPMSADSGQWDSEFSNWYSGGDSKPGEPFASDEDAVVAAKSWARRHFGIGSDDLEVKAIDHSASGAPEPSGIDDRGHTIVLKQLFRGIPTDGYAVVYIRGKAITVVAVEFYGYRPIPETAKPSVTSAIATTTWRKLFQQQGASEEDLARYDAEVVPRLDFVYSYRPGADVEHSVPTWVIMEGAPYMVDAHTGRAWIDD